ncbi:MAG: site-specific integrase [Clostridia bacterium]|nr:site-specific integrase [Clostridia bacterium]
MNLITLILEYLDNHRYTIKHRTYLFYLQLTGMYLTKGLFLSPLEQITQTELNEFILEKYQNKKLSNSTLKLIKGLINRSLLYGYKRNYINQKIEIEVVLKSNVPNKVEDLTNEEIKKLELYIVSRKKVYSYGVLISFYTGVRIGELLSLKWQDIDFKTKIITINSTTCKIAHNHKVQKIIDTPKTSSSLRQIPLSKNVLELLKGLKEFQKGQSEFVVSRQNGKQIDMRSYQDSFYRLLRKLKIKHYGFHSLRHTFATRCYKLGMDIKTLSEILGHSSPSITLNRYVHTNIQTKRNALESVNRKIRNYVYSVI